MIRSAPATIIISIILLSSVACAPMSRTPKQAIASGVPAGSTASINAAPVTPSPIASAPFVMTEVADFAEPWAMAFMPDSNQILVTERAGRLLLLTPGAPPVAVIGLPLVDYAGQGGLGDVALHPDFAANQLIYFSWVEAGERGTSGAVVGRARFDAVHRSIGDIDIVWRQFPKIDGNGHFGHRIAFGPDGMLYISSGERQQFDPAQDNRGNLGKIVRLNDDGTVPSDNPLASLATQLSSVTGPQEAAMRQIWSLGHRNPLGIAFDDTGRLWELEMGPAGGDELNLIERGGNYGYPLASNGNHYDGRDIPDHTPADGFVAPRVWWNPAISPSDLMIYSGSMFPAWRGDAFIAGLGGQALVRVDLNGDTATPGERWATGFRVRAVRQGPDGALYMLEDGGRRGQGRLFRLTPRA